MKRRADAPPLLEEGPKFHEAGDPRGDLYVSRAGENANPLAVPTIVPPPGAPVLTNDDLRRRAALEHPLALNTYGSSPQHVVTPVLARYSGMFFRGEVVASANLPAGGVNVTFRVDELDGAGGVFGSLLARRIAYVGVTSVQFVFSFGDMESRPGAPWSVAVDASVALGRDAWLGHIPRVPTQLRVSAVSNLPPALGVPFVLFLDGYVRP